MATRRNTYEVRYDQVQGWTIWNTRTDEAEASYGKDSAGEQLARLTAFRWNGEDKED